MVKQEDHRVRGTEQTPGPIPSDSTVRVIAVVAVVRPAQCVRRVESGGTTA